MTFILQSIIQWSRLTAIRYILKANNDKIVLRADKILATRDNTVIIEDRINSREDIYEILQKYGVCYVVVENRGVSSTALRMLKDEVTSDNFFLRKLVPIHSNIATLSKTSLGIYEYKDFTKARNDAILDMNIPLMGDHVVTRFGDLLNKEIQ